MVDIDYYDDDPFNHGPINISDRSSVTLRGFVRLDGRTLENTPVQAWLNALRSGEYRQTTGQLAVSGGYCCLGVACALAVRAGVIESFNGYGGDLSGYPKVRAFFGLRSVSGSYEDRSLIDDNDGVRKSFAQIADIIESRPEGLFS